MASYRFPGNSMRLQSVTPQTDSKVVAALHPLKALSKKFKRKVDNFYNGGGNLDHLLDDLADIFEEMGDTGIALEKLVQEIDELDKENSAAPIVSAAESTADTTGKLRANTESAPAVISPVVDRSYPFETSPAAALWLSSRLLNFTDIAGLNRLSRMIEVELDKSQPVPRVRVQINLRGMSFSEWTSLRTYIKSQFEDIGCNVNFILIKKPDFYPVLHHPATRLSGKRGLTT